MQPAYEEPETPRLEGVAVRLLYGLWDRAGCWNDWTRDTAVLQLRPVPMAKALIPPKRSWLAATIQKSPASDPWFMLTQVQPTRATVTSRATPAENGQTTFPAPWLAKYSAIPRPVKA